MSNKLRITLDQLRIASKQVKGRYTNPCFDKIEKITNAMEVANFKIQPLYKYVQEADECYEQADIEEKKRGQGGTLYHLNKYLDRKKFKKQK